MNKEINTGLVWGGGLIVLAAGATFARNLGFVEADTVTRLVFGSIGLMTAWYGNRIPKTFVASSRARRAQRTAGWSTALSGLAYAGLWAFAPIPTAIWAGTGAILTGLAITFGYCLANGRKAKAA